MKYFVKMAHSISEAFYKVTPSFLLFGMGQGSGASPAIWLTIVAPIAMTFLDPWQDVFDEQNVDSYVDDTSLRCNDAHMTEHMCYKQLLKHGQELAQIWERILYILAEHLNYENASGTYCTGSGSRANLNLLQTLKLQGL